MASATLNRLQKKAVDQGIDLDRLPHHLAIIMDGNGRWAKKKGWQRLLGHREGYKALRGALLDASGPFSSVFSFVDCVKQLLFVRPR